MKDYDDHINIIQNCLFVAKTTKGSETITFCELFRLSSVEERAKAYQNTGPNILEQLVGELTNPNVKNKQELIDTIKNAIK